MEQQSDRPQGEGSEFFELPETAPASYAEARKLLDDSLGNIPPYEPAPPGPGVAELPDRLRYAATRANAVATRAALADALYALAFALDEEPPYVVEAIGRALDEGR